MNILVRADGSFKRGMGHISKQTTLCRKLRELGHEILFITPKNEATYGILRENGFLFKEMHGDALTNINEFIDEFSPDVIILDILDTTSEYIHGLRKYGAKIVTFDNVDVSAFECDLIFNVMYYHSPEIKKGINHSALYEGYRYIIMDEIYKGVPSLNNHEVRRILLTQGGADTANKTCVLLESLLSVRKLTPIPFSIDMVVGPAFDAENVKNIEKLAAENDMIHIHYNAKGLAKLLALCNMAVTAGGTTMWEVASCKRPFYILINEAFEDETARLISSLGFGLYDGVSPSRERVESSLARLITDVSLRMEMIDKMEQYALSRGVDRIIEKMREHQVLV